MYQPYKRLCAQLKLQNYIITEHYYNNGAILIFINMNGSSFIISSLKKTPFYKSVNAFMTSLVIIIQ